MARIKLTDSLVATTPAGAREAFLWDEVLPRFGVRISPQGGRFYLVQYRAKGPAGSGSTSRRVYIGQHDGELWNVTKARAAARKLLAPVDLGEDPYAAREGKRLAERAAKVAAKVAAAEAVKEAERRARETVEVLIESYITRRLAKRRSGAEAARLLRYDVAPAWGERHVSEVRRADVAELIETIAERSPAVARAVFAEVRIFFEWCVAGDKIAASPCAGVKAPPRPASRDRVLSDDELRLIWRASAGLGFPFGPVFQLLMLTGQRRAEVAGMRWAELDLDAARWRIPAERAKNKQAHEIDLAPEALEIIAAVTRDGPLLFPGRGTGRKPAKARAADTFPVTGFSATKRALDAAIEALRADDAAQAGEDPPAQPLTPWRIHDLRRTAATGMAALAFPPHVVERVINHVSNTQGGLVGVYQRHEFRPERKAALIAWGAHVAAAVRDEPMPSNVVELAAQRG